LALRTQGRERRSTPATHTGDAIVVFVDEIESVQVVA